MGRVWRGVLRLPERAEKRPGVAPATNEAKAEHEAEDKAQSAPENKRRVRRGRVTRRG